MLNSSIRPEGIENEVIGRIEYLSADAIQFKTQSRRDDFKSLIYSLLALRNGTTFHHSVKKTITPLEMCQKADMPLFEEVFQCIFDLKYDDIPNYSKIEFLFKKVLLDIDMLPNNFNYDWAAKNLRPVNKKASVTSCFFDDNIDELVHRKTKDKI